MHINILERQAVKKACKSFLPLILSLHVLITSDNSTTVFHISKQEGTNSEAEVVNLWNWCTKQSDHPIFSLHSEDVEYTRQTICNRPRMGISLQSATRHYRKMWDPNQRSLLLLRQTASAPCNPTGGALGNHSQGDALLLSWSYQLNYIFPPLPPLPQVLHKI